MFRTNGTRRRTIAVLGSVGVLALAGVAIAYFTASGSGTGTGSAGTSTAFVLHGSVTDPLYPGTSSDVTFTVDNKGSGNQKLDTIHLDSVSTDKPGCVVADFSMPNVVVSHDYAPGDGQAVTPKGTISMANTNVSQDACKGATLTLSLSSN